MKDSYYFISDIHLGLETPAKEVEKENKLVSFLSSIKDEAIAIYIVGDLFDYWFEYRRVIQKGNFRLFSILKQLTDSGVEIKYIIGNHDFMHRDFFQNELGVKVFEEPLVAEINGRKFFIAHGDGLIANDFGYKVLKKILRNKFIQFLYSLLHPDFGIWLASKSSKSSREYTKQKDYGEKDSLSLSAQNYIDNNFDYVIFGHSHRKEIRTYKNGCYINLGSWLEQPCYGIFRNNNFEVLNWK